MAKKKKKDGKLSFRRKNGLTMTVEDEFGALQPPPMSTETAQETLGQGILIDRSRGFEKAAKWTVRIGIAVTAIIVIMTMFSSVTTLMSNSDTKSMAEKAQSPAFKTRYQDLGKGIIEAYYGGLPPPTSLMSDVTWSTVGGTDQIGISSGGDSTGTASAGTGSGVVTGTKVKNITFVYGTSTPFMLPAKAANDKNVAPLFPNPRREVLYYYGTVGQNVYQFSVSLVIPDQDDYRMPPYLEKQPVMMEMTPLTRVSAQIDRPDPSVLTNGIEFTEKALPQPAVDVVATWASAFAQNDGDTLKRLTGDSSTKEYSGIGGFALVGTPSVDWSYAFTTSKEFIVAQVTFSIVTKSSMNSDGTDSSSSSDSSRGEAPDQFISNQSLVVLIENADKGVPNISAWGPPGSWNRISPYQNGVVTDAKNLSSTPMNDESTGEDGKNSELTENTSAPSAPSVSAPKTTSKKKTTTTKKRPSSKTSRNEN